MAEKNFHKVEKDFYKVMMYARGDLLFLELEKTSWSWESDSDDKKIKQSRKRGKKEIIPLKYNIKCLGGNCIVLEDGAAAIGLGQPGGQLLTNEFVFAKDSQIHFQNGGYIEIVTPENITKSKSVMVRRRERDPKVNEVLQIAAGKNIYIEVDFSANKTAEPTLSPLIFHEQAAINSLNGTNEYLLLAEKQAQNQDEIDHETYWKIFDDQRIWSHPYQITKTTSEETYLLTVNQDKDRKNTITGQPYFELFADSIPITNLDGSPTSSELYDFDFNNNFLCIGYANVKPSTAGEEDGFTEEEYTFEGVITRLVFDPNAVCPC